MIRALLLTACLPTGATACAVAEEFLPTDLAAAPVVITATVTAYHQQADYVGVLTVDVTGVFKGEAPATLILEWSPDLSEWPPERWDRETDIILGARPPQDGRDWQLAVETCGSAWIISDTAENRAIVAGAITASGAAG
jgi:hypothetical protein